MYVCPDYICKTNKTQIRVSAIRGLQSLCTRNPKFVARIADVLGQLLLIESQQELQVVRQVFKALIDQDIEASFGALVEQIATSETEALKEAGIHTYIHTYI